MSDPHPLVFRFGAFGDMVMITPMLRRLYERCGLPCDVVGIGGWTKTMFEQMPYVRHVHTINSRSTPYLISRDKKRLVRTLRRDAHTACWLLESNRHSYKLASKAGIDDAINGLDFPRHAGEHITRHWCRLAEESPAGFEHLPTGSDDCDTELFVSDEELKACRDWLNEKSIDQAAPLICIQAGNKKTMRAGRNDRDSNTKYWHQKNWAMVINRILEHDSDARILLCGVPAEQTMTLDILRLCSDPSRVVSVADELPVRRLFALLSMAHSCISVDTGPAHAAAALNCDVTVLYGKADARICSPVSSDSGVVKLAGRIAGTELDESLESWAQCHDISLITPDDVFAGWLECTTKT